VNRAVRLERSPTRKILKQEVSTTKNTQLKTKKAYHTLSGRSQTTVGNEDGFDNILPVLTHDENKKPTRGTFFETTQ